MARQSCGIFLVENEQRSGFDMVHTGLERIKDEINEIDREGKLILLEYLVSSMKQEDRKAVDRYRFSDLAGKLAWSGDALVEQRKLRNEW
jgi:hypothetical protein